MYPTFEQLQAALPPQEGSRVGTTWTAPDPTDPRIEIEHLVVWDPTYRHPAQWGHTRGLLFVDEGQPLTFGASLEKFPKPRRRRSRRRAYDTREVLLSKAA